MPRYFFNTADGSRDRDVEGTELADLNAARKEAIQFTGAVLRDDPDRIWDGRDFRVDVSDENDTSLLIVITMAIDAVAVWPKRETS